MSAYPRGIFKRGDIWWFRVGKHRHSSRSTCMEDALELRTIALQSRVRTHIPDDWRAYVAERRGDSSSWVRRAYSHMRRKTRLREWHDCVAFEEFVSLVLRSRGVCAITGIPFSRVEGKHDPFSISVDRIDSSKGYCVGNVRLVLLAVNLAMSHWGEDAFRRIARAFVGRELLSPDVFRENMFICTVTPEKGNVPHGT